ncbi:MAG: M15 family metallopeptidase [Sulfuricurvum sp.]|uniref:M15 family metallopeptidase n=1 Tax=Sulfuricurvum sp. TaxID=2025608 RepID=UPI00262FF621|nr:M15 family metallopeptidase [Sulfuricurvum sp.]MDD2829026.1 M15 family metallopeptidase [Sulfuricurvum sp.]MDD4949673.1 M15 family metallopeptidase [Sulfuricurvum sp.]
MDRRTFLTLSALTGATTLFAQLDEIEGNKQIFSGNILVTSLLQKLTIVQNQVGYVQFNILSFDELLKTAVRCKKPLTPQEVQFIESIFYGDPRRYGFYGERTVPQLSTVTQKKDVTYMDKTGHFLMRGPAMEKYTQIKRLVGNDLVLTSGVRAPVKQLYLFLKKMEFAGGDLRLTSTSIAPPGFTFHSVGDFDIGKVGFGQYNFTEKFQETDVFKKLYDGGYISIRYTTNNPYGVRYEPWHIKVTGGNETA